MECKNCGNDLTEGKEFCNVACKLEYEADHIDHQEDSFQKFTKTIKPNWA